MNSIQQATFFILGCQRSGTTLLGMSLQAHPAIEFIEETDSRFHHQYFLTKRIDLESVVNYQSPNGKLIGFKSPRDSHRIKDIAGAIPHAKVLWVTREIYQVVASMLAPLGRAQSSWATLHAQNEVTKYFYEGWFDPILAEQCNWLLSLQDERQRLIGLTCVCWIAKLNCGSEASKQFGESFYKVKYDDFVTAPKKVLAGVLQFLEIEWNSSVLKHPEILHGPRPGGATTKRPIESLSLGKWKSQLSRADINFIDSFVREHKAKLQTVAL